MLTFLPLLVINYLENTSPHYIPGLRIAPLSHIPGSHNLVIQKKQFGDPNSCYLSRDAGAEKH